MELQLYKKGSLVHETPAQCMVSEKDRTTLDLLYAALLCIARGYFCDSNL